MEQIGIKKEICEFCNLREYCQYNYDIECQVVADHFNNDLAKIKELLYQRAIIISTLFIRQDEAIINKLKTINRRLRGLRNKELIIDGQDQISLINLDLVPGGK